MHDDSNDVYKCAHVMYECMDGCTYVIFRKLCESG